ncbi:MAG: hypothetical protein PHR35_00965, partial [Kiritimatiellae bacterium]|nr:hypothetical protein [Kiritimatiellia bacterium]
MKLVPSVVSLGLCFLGSLAKPVHAETVSFVRNGSFEIAEPLRADDPRVTALVKAKWSIPADLVFPQSWGPNPNTPGGALDYVRAGGWKSGAFVRLNGGGHLASSYGGVNPGNPYVASFQVRGTGTVSFGVYEYDETGQIGGKVLIERAIADGKWREFKGLYSNVNPRVSAVNLFVAGQGPVDVDEVQFEPADPVTADMALETVRLYGSGLLIEDADILAIRADDFFRQRLADYDAALKTFLADAEEARSVYGESVRKKAAELEPYLRGEHKKQVLSRTHNEWIAFTRVLKKKAGLPIDPPAPLKMEPIRCGWGYKPGERAARPGAVTVTDVRSNKVRYDENENATTVATLVNATEQQVAANLSAVLLLDLDESREVAKGQMALQPGTNVWRFTYNVGPETYGRAVEVCCRDETGETLDRWQEYYPVAAEWFRVQQHCGGVPGLSYRTDEWVTYYNQSHWFASEPTDFGVHATNVQEYLSPQVGYHMNMQSRIWLIARRKETGVNSTIYQNASYSGQMGYDVIRRHPEFALYDANGQWATDPFYGGVPNPMEIASPIEIGASRVVRKPYLDRKITPWGHGII